MPLTEKELDHLAHLSKLKLTAIEKEKFSKNMDEIIRFLGQLNKVDMTNLHPERAEEPLSCFREISSFEEPASLLKNSKHQQGEFLAIQTSLKS